MDDDCITFTVPEEPEIVVQQDIEEDVFIIPEDDHFHRVRDDNVFRREGRSS